MPELDAVLFDLDDTLLGNNMEQFLLFYFPLVARYVAPVMDGERFLTELMIGTQAMIANQDQDQTNREVFWSVFCQRNDLDQEEMESFIEGFYRERFSELKKYTTCRPVARKIVQLCLDHDLLIVVATNPLFPRIAIDQRLEWAGVPSADFDYALITSYENMHSAKPHMSYYREILEKFDLIPERTLMVGDDWNNDIIPAEQLGLKTYWVSDEVPDGEKGLRNHQGTLDDLYAAFRSSWIIS